MTKEKLKSIGRFAFEFLSIFIGVFAAFALDNWNDKRKDHLTEIKILGEINNGLKQDIKDITLNELGHKQGLRAVAFFEQLLLNQHPKTDSTFYHYFYVVRDFISVQNVSGYETLKSKGLEIVENDSLRTELLSLYENDYNTVRKLEESYPEMQFFAHYFQTFNNVLAPNFILNEKGRVIGINDPLRLSEKDRKILFSILGKIKNNRNFILSNYKDVKSKILKLQKSLEVELRR